MYDNNNIFAKIIRGEIPCEKVYEDNSCLFFYDIMPAAKIHVLGIPKSPHVDFSDFINNSEPTAVSVFFKRVYSVIDQLGIKNNGYRLVANSGANGGQEVPHFHVHILGGEQLTTKT